MRKAELGRDAAKAKYEKSKMNKLRWYKRRKARKEYEKELGKYERRKEDYGP